ncbi:MAG: hypothetical protein ACOC93_03160, partial [Planctomycetota bacterium]
KTTPPLNALTLKHLLNQRYDGQAEAVGFDRDHNISFPHYNWSDTREWMLTHRLEPNEPNEVHFRTGTLRYGQFRWVELEQMDDHGKLADVRARYDRAERCVTLEVANAERLHLQPPGPSERIEVIEGGARSEIDVADVSTDDGITLQHRGGRWRLEANPRSPASPNAEKRRGGTYGPIWNICAGSSPVLAVYGTGGSEAETANLRELANHVARLDTAWGAGHFPVVADTEVTEQHKTTHRLLLIGDARSNCLLAGHDWPFDLQAIGAGEGITVGEETYDGEADVLSFVYPSPWQQGQLVYVVSPAQPAAAPAALRPTDTWSIATWQDWVLQRVEQGRRGWRGETYRGGAFDNQWKLGPAQGEVIRPRYMNWE